MLDSANYSVFERLPSGRRIQVRALRPQDRESLLSAVARTSTTSLYRRFFRVKRQFSEKEIAFFVNVDFAKHVALVVVADEGGAQRIIAGGRYVVEEPGAAEVAFVVIDEYQGHGIGSALMRHLTAIARDASLKQLIAHVLPDNAGMLKIFEKCGLRTDRTRDADGVHITLHLS